MEPIEMDCDSDDENESFYCGEPIAFDDAMGCYDNPVRSTATTDGEPNQTVAFGQANVFNSSALSLDTLPQMGHHPMQAGFRVPPLPSHMQAPELPSRLVCPSPLPSLPPIRSPGNLPPLNPVPHYSPPQSARLNAELAEKARQKAASEDAECQQVVEEEAARKFAQDEAARQKATPPATADTAATLDQPARKASAQQATQQVGREAAMLAVADIAAMESMEMDLDSDNECNEIDADLSALEEVATAAKQAEEDAAYAAWLLAEQEAAAKQAEEDAAYAAWLLADQEAAQLAAEEEAFAEMKVKEESARQQKAKEELLKEEAEQEAARVTAVAARAAVAELRGSSMNISDTEVYLNTIWLSRMSSICIALELL